MLSQTSSISTELDASAAAKKALEYARILFEKCELKKAKEAYLEAFHVAKSLGDRHALSQAISGLLRLAAEASDPESIEQWNKELDLIMKEAPLETLPLAWYCKGVVASYQNNHRLAHRYYLKALKTGNNQSEQRYAHRYVGSMVGDIHRTLLYGGIFCYPADSGQHPRGNLQLLYKSAPMAFVVEKAGGKSMNQSGESLLQVRPERVHQKSPCFMGSPDDVEECKRYLQRDVEGNK